jgi:hypothetical protein
MTEPRMTPGEVGKLLGLMALADNRKPPDEADREGRQAMIFYWLEMIGDLTYADCAQAVRDHYRDSREWIMPADIRRRVRAIRDARLARTRLPAPAPEIADDTTAYREVLADTIRAAADGTLPVADEGPKMIGPAPGRRTGGPPVSLGAAIGQLRRKMGSARGQHGIEAPEAIAGRQVAEHRAAEAERDKTEEAS